MNCCSGPQTRHLLSFGASFTMAALSYPLMAAPSWLFASQGRGKIGSVRHLPVWGVACGTAWLARTFVLDAKPWIQLLLCGLVALLAGAAYISVSTPSRRVALNLFSIMRELKNARASSGA
jgi:hypothetical protein